MRTTAQPEAEQNPPFPHLLSVQSPFASFWARKAVFSSAFFVLLCETCVARVLVSYQKLEDVELPVVANPT